MKILHYSLGTPPYRTGGLTKYSIDLMISQVMNGNDVSLLYPGRFSIKKSMKYKKNKEYNGIKIYEIINPLPVSLLGGIGDPEKFRETVDIRLYTDFLNEIKPDIIHMHTLMGIHKEFIEAAKLLDIKIVYTTHDYFGICPKVNLIDINEQLCCDYEDGKKCAKCNKNSYSMNMIYIMQSKSYRFLKNIKLVKKIRRYKKSKFNSIQDKSEAREHIETLCLEKEKDYMQLRKYYIDILSSVDYMHFNSTIAKHQYEKYISNIKGDVLNITHSDIKRNNLEKLFSSQNERLRITYLGPMDKYKGYYLLKDSLDNLSSKGVTNWTLNVYGDDNASIIDDKYYTFHGRYLYDELEKIFDNTDIIVIPSICKETFGFIGLEALSYGVPVMISSYVGLKDIVDKYSFGISFNPNIKELSDTIESIISDRSILSNINKEIIRQNLDFTMEKHSKDIIDLYNRVIEKRI